jgi:hypothetical protein
MPAKAKLQRVLLNLARSKEFPDGSRKHGYDLVAPLKEDGHLDVELWKANRERCTVRRFWPGEVDEHGLLVHRAGGAEGATWTFDYNPGATDDDEAGYRLGSHLFKPGEYVSVRDDDGVLHTFRVATVSDA